jgi:hypothetical protein
MKNAARRIEKPPRRCDTLIPIALNRSVSGNEMPHKFTASSSTPRVCAGCGTRTAVAIKSVLRRMSVVY